ncbi:MAG: RNA 2',3'-cyclic phosphodiesterase [Bacteroidales bacterium]|nr:RNA 2',3'-cyclic phosphodiesterase [Bacteroidales bacterium]
MKRLFVAIKIIPDEQFLSVYYSLKREMVLDKLKWVEPQNFHLTLKFLGNTATDKIPAITKALNDVAKIHQNFSFALDKTGLFGSRYRPRVLWFGSDPVSESLIALGEDVLNGLDQAGFQRDSQNFVPHLTIARIKQVVRKEAFQKTVLKHQNDFIQQVSVDSFYLFESILKPQGPEYKIIRTFKLA